MTLEESLEELRNTLLRDSSSQIAGDSDHFWPEPSLLRYIHEAQRRFARRALCIRDATTAAVCEVVLVADTPMYDLHKSILQVISARHQDATQDLVRVKHSTTYARLNPYTDSVASPPLDGFFTSSPSPSQPVEFSTDEGLKVEDAFKIKLLLRPTPSTEQAGKKIYLRVARMPLVDITATSSLTGTSLELPEDWQLDMLEWAAFRAWRTYDGEDEQARAYAEKKAKQHRERFEEAVLEALKETQNKMLQPITWGFGQAGFARYIKN